MKTLTALGALAALALAAPALAHTSVSIGLGIGIPPPPVVVYEREPRWQYVPDERVYVVDDDDCPYDYFRYAGWYWIYDNDQWYRARRYRGPFFAVRAEYVPVPIWRVGDRDEYQWRHRPSAWPSSFTRDHERRDLPPGWNRRGGRWDNDDHDRRHGHGHDRDYEDDDR